MNSLQKTHCIKCNPSHFDAILNGLRATVRSDDRPYAVGDRLVLQFFDANAKVANRYDGSAVFGLITHIITPTDAQGLRVGNVVLAFDAQVVNEVAA